MTSPDPLDVLRELVSDFDTIGRIAVATYQQAKAAIEAAETQDRPDPWSYTLRGEGTDREAKIKVSAPGTGCAIFIEVEGMENVNGNPLLAIDLHEGTLALFAWTDKQGEEYTHRLDLDAGRITEAHEGHAGLTSVEMDLIHGNRFLAAIKEVRNRTGLSLKESKAIVDRERNRR